MASDGADALKALGNAAYKEGRLGDALAFYQRAVAAAPGEAVYLSNCSAALYELGRYGEAARAALDGLACAATTDKLTQKLATRHAKSLFYQGRHAEAAEALGEIAGAVRGNAELEGMLSVAQAQAAQAAGGGEGGGVPSVPGVETGTGAGGTPSCDVIHAACRPPPEHHIDEFWVFGQRACPGVVASLMCVRLRVRVCVCACVCVCARARAEGVLASSWGGGAGL